MNALATPEPVVAAAIFTSLAGVVLLTMLVFLVRRLIKDHAGVMLFHYHPIRVRRAETLADRNALEQSSRQLQGAEFRF